MIRQIYFELLCLLLYADDTVIISEFEEQLQYTPSCTYTYCLENELSVNMSKLKHWYFQSTTKFVLMLPMLKYREAEIIGSPNLASI